MRTDRCHHYYYGNSDDDNENVKALLNILTTYALNHKDKYCQGMSDLASPLLYAMKGILDLFIGAYILLNYSVPQMRRTHTSVSVLL